MNHNMKNSKSHFIDISTNEFKTETHISSVTANMLIISALFDITIVCTVGKTCHANQNSSSCEESVVKLSTLLTSYNQNLIFSIHNFIMTSLQRWQVDFKLTQISIGMEELQFKINIQNVFEI